MSTRLSQSALRATKLTLSQRAIFSRICEKVNTDTNLFYEPLATIANDLNVSKRYIRQCIAELIALDFIIDTGERKGKTNQIKVYKINLSERGNNCSALKGEQSRIERGNKCSAFHVTKGFENKKNRSDKQIFLSKNSWQDRLINEAIERQDISHTNGNHNTSVSEMKRIIDIIKDSRPGEHHEQD